MRVRLCALLLCAAVLLTAGSAGVTAAEEELIFISINELLPPELINCVTSYGGATYVPYSVFSDYGLGISYAFFSTASTVYLSTTRDKQLFFEVTTGNTYDGADNSYDAPAIMRSGVVYLPVGLVCSFFGGLNYSLLPGNQYGRVLRIRSSSVVLTDEDFVRVAEGAMQAYGRKYLSEHGDPYSPPPVYPTDPPQPVTHEGDSVYLSFVGLPAEPVLEALKTWNMTACFFLRGEEIAENPDLVRRLAGEGHSLGIYCAGDPEKDWRYGSMLLYEAARFPTAMVAAAAGAAEDCAALSELLGLAYCAPGLSTAPEDTQPLSPQYLLERLSGWQGNASVRLDGREAAAENAIYVLRYLNEQRYEVVCPNEADGAAGGREV